LELINASDVWKSFRIYHDKGSTLKERVLFRGRNRYEERWVLKGVNLHVEQGESVGLMGENGSGKSTLLKLLTRIIYPNRGTIDVQGKVSSLLELGAGFHPDLTGRENIYMNASIFGLSKQEIDRKLSEIIAFSELAPFIDTPVRTYSSGMYMRLAFSVAINVNADILLIDEILAVGDVNFQKKCFDRLKDLKKRGTTIVIVSHDLSSIQKICDRAVWLEDGSIQATGGTTRVIDQYMQFMNRKQEATLKEEQAREQEQHRGKSAEETEGDADREKPESDPNCWGGKEVEITSVRMRNADGEQKYSFEYGEPVCIEIGYIRHREMEGYVFGIGISNSDGVSCYGTNTDIDGRKIKTLNSRGTVFFHIDRITLVEGKYRLDAASHAEDGRAYDYRKNIYEFAVTSSVKDTGIARQEHQWIIK
jgi:ABC-2 type transport system ATP-binding protein